MAINNKPLITSYIIPLIAGLSILCPLQYFSKCMANILHEAAA